MSAAEGSSGAPQADLAPIADLVSGVVRAVGDDDLSRPTPCPGSSVATMLDHLAGLTVAFTAVAHHEPVPGGDQPPVPDAARLDPQFRDAIPRRLEALGAAWSQAVAWTGGTRVAGVDLPREVAGLVALNELVVHGWDLAVAIGHPYQPGAAAVAGALGFVGPTAAERPQGTPGLFGPPVAVPPDAPPLKRLLGLTGRDPRWSRP